LQQFIIHHITQEDFKMIDVVTTLKVVPGKTRSHAVEWAKKNLEHSKKAGLIDGPLFLLRPETGERNYISFVERHPSMAKYEEAMSKRRADSGWTASVREAMESDWYLGGTRQIYNVIEVIG
jgi:hypothetical protein